MSNKGDLLVVDVSNVVYAGNINKRARIVGEMRVDNGEYVEPYIPSGGLAFLFNIIAAHPHDTIVFCIDRYPTTKLAMYPDYKANRRDKHDDDVDRQRELAEIILKSCGYQVVARDGLEADDLIYSICKKYKSEYDRIRVFSRDSDLLIVIDDNVQMEPVTSNGRLITRENFETQANLKLLTKFNVVSFNKFLGGDPKDNIKPLAPGMREKIASMFDTEFYYSKMNNREFMRAMIEDVMPAALPQFDIVYPIYTDIDVIENPRLNQDNIRFWGNRVMNSYYRQQVRNRELEALIETWM